MRLDNYIIGPKDEGPRKLPWVLLASASLPPAPPGRPHICYPPGINFGTPMPQNVSQKMIQQAELSFFLF